MKRTLLIVFVVLGFINFFVFAIFSMAVGGNAANGYIKDGMYYLGNHGVYKQVSEKLWYFNKGYSNFTVFLHPFLILAMAVLGFTRKKCDKNS